MTAPGVTGVGPGVTGWVRERDATAKLLAAALFTGAVLATVDPFVTAVAIGIGEVAPVDERQAERRKEPR